MNVKEIMKSMNNNLILPHHKIESKLIDYIKNEFGVEISTSTTIPTPFGIIPSIALSIMLSRKKEYRDVLVSNNLKPFRFSINYEEGWEQELLSSVAETLIMWGFDYEAKDVRLWLEWSLRPLTQERLDAQSSYISKRGGEVVETSDTEEVGEETNFLSGLSD